MEEGMDQVTEVVTDLDTVEDQAMVVVMVIAGEILK